MAANQLVNWLAVLPIEALDRTGHLRLDRSVQGVVNEVENQLLLRGQSLTNEVLSLPFEKFYRCDELGRLFPLRGSLPELHLDPALEWQSLSELIVPAAIEMSHCLESLPGFAEVKIVRGGGAVVTANLLKVEKEAWYHYAITAPEVRLTPLHFAASADEVLIRGIPLPAISGESFFESQGIAIPCGFRLEPAISFDILAQAFHPGEGELIMLYPNGVTDRIAAENFVPASRAAVRMTYA